MEDQMIRNSGKEVRLALVVDNFMPRNNHHDLLGFYIHQSRRKYFMIFFGVAALISLVTFALTFTIVSSKSLEVAAGIPSTTKAISTPTSTPTSTPSTNKNFSGQIALTEVELRDEIRKTSSTIFWAGPMSGAKYTFTNTEAGLTQVRYLPNGQGLSDSTPIYRVIATYPSANAYDTIVGAFNPKIAVGITNPDGTVIYYAKATPTHVFMAFKGLDYQIEIFDPTPGASLKLATTPGAIVPIR